MNEIKTKKMVQRINKSKSWFFEKANKIDRRMAQLTLSKRRNPKLTKSEMTRETLQQTIKKFRIL